MAEFFFQHKLRKNNYNNFTQMEYERFHVDNQYEVKAIIAKGGQANVYLCRKAHQLFAAKVYFSNFKFFHKQAIFYEKFSHPSIIKFIECKKNVISNLPDLGESVSNIIILQYAHRFKLSDYIASSGRMSPEICRRIFKTILNVVEYLHNLGISHRDLKLENLLMDKQYNLKIADFGFVVFKEEQSEEGFLFDKLGSRGYKPIEMELGKYKGINADLFASTVILFILLLGQQPFSIASKMDKQYRFILNKQYDKYWSTFQQKLGSSEKDIQVSIKEFFNSCFAANPNQRPNILNFEVKQWLKGRQATQEQLKQEMKKRYEVLIQNDEEIRRIDEIVKFFEARLDLNPEQKAGESPKYNQLNTTTCNNSSFSSQK